MTAAADPPAPRRAPQPADQPALRSVPQPSEAMPSQPAGADAVAMTLTGLGTLARTDWASQPTAALAATLLDLERAESVLVAARSRVLAAFTAQRGFEDDGQGSARSWLTWQSRVTRPAANAAVSWARRLGEHPALADALAGGRVSVSWARQLADWSDLLPAGARGEADAILAAAAANGLDLAGVGRLAEEIRRRTATPDTDGPDDGFGDRALHLAATLGGAGRLTGDLTARCAASLAAVLDSLARKAGPEDTRTAAQRRHDALEEACRRLLASGCLPDRAGQPVHLNLQLTLDQLLNGLDPHPGPGDTGSGGAGPDGPEPGWPAAAMAGPGDDCDAALVPMVTGRVDHDLLDALAGRLVPGTPLWAAFHPARPGPCEQCGHTPPAGPATAHLATPGTTATSRTSAAPPPAGCSSKPPSRCCPAPAGSRPCCAPAPCPRPPRSVSLPLDVGPVTELVPPHLRRAIIARDQHCAAPGCSQPPAACHVHHIVPRSQGGTTSLANCLLMCPFHHLILIHRWGWTITLNADGTTTATSPNGKQLHSHSPPPATAA